MSAVEQPRARYAIIFCYPLLPRTCHRPVLVELAWRSWGLPELAQELSEVDAARSVAVNSILT